MFAKMVGQILKEEWRAIRIAQQDRAHLATVARQYPDPGCQAAHRPPIQAAAQFPEVLSAAAGERAAE